MFFVVLFCQELKGEHLPDPSLPLKLKNSLFEDESLSLEDLLSKGKGKVAQVMLSEI